MFIAAKAVVVFEANFVEANVVVVGTGVVIGAGFMEIGDPEGIDSVVETEFVEGKYV